MCLKHVPASNIFDGISKFYLVLSLSVGLVLVVVVKHVEHIRRVK